MIIPTRSIRLWIAAFFAFALSKSVHCSLSNPDIQLPDVRFYGEALCPYCRNFTIYTVSPLFRNNVWKLFNFKYIPWGNTRVDPKSGKVTCQHGPLECQYNTLQGCAMHFYPGPEVWLPYVECIYKDGRTPKGADAEKLSRKCAQDANMDAERIWTCSQGGELGCTLLYSMCAHGFYL